ncbi:MAG TPA: GDP-mannose 4,6-dehydratase [Gemmatimonadaceae bacterium]
MRALVTGAAGFVGQWLCEALVSRGWDVFGARLGDDVPAGRLGPRELGAIRWIDCDVTHAGAIAAALDASTPDVVFHLAGVAFVPDATADPAGTLEVNVVAAARLLSAIGARRRAGTLDPVVLVVGSGEQYGRHDATEQPLGERAEQRPLNPYAASKAAQEVIALAAHRATGVRAIVTRSFNHSGAGQADRFLIPALVRRVRELRTGSSKPGVLSMGTTSTVRDFLHVGDVIAAYIALVEKGAAGEAYNVASGTGVAVDAVARRVLALMGVDAKLEVDPALVRPVEVPMLVGDARKLRDTTGWAPRLSLDTIIDDVIRAAPL